MRTLEPQILLPIPVRLQWTVKLGVVALVASALAIGVPRAVAALAGFRSPGWNEGVIVLSLAVGSLYVSSITASGLRALLWSLPVWLITVGPVDYMARTFRHWAQWAADPILDRVGSAAYAAWSIRSWLQFQSTLLQITIAVALVAAIVFAARNYRTSEHSRKRVAAQLLVVFMIMTAGRSIQLTLGEAWFKAFSAAQRLSAPANRGR